MAGFLRISGGVLGGRRLRVPGGNVRPTQERVREALFSMLQASVPGAWFLDVFAGSGAVGLEAWSRGADRVSWVESDRRVFSVLKDNVQTLCGSSDAARCRLQDVMAFCRDWREERGYDMVFADPPYARGLPGMPPPAAGLLEALGRGTLVAPGGRVILEQGRRDEAPPPPPGWRMTGERAYGGSYLRFYGRKETAP